MIKWSTHEDQHMTYWYKISSERVEKHLKWPVTRPKKWLTLNSVELNTTYSQLRKLNIDKINTGSIALNEKLNELGLLIEITLHTQQNILCVPFYYIWNIFKARSYVMKQSR